VLQIGLLLYNNISQVDPRLIYTFETTRLGDFYQQEIFTIKRTKTIDLGNQEISIAQHDVAVLMAFDYMQSPGSIIPTILMRDFRFVHRIEKFVRNHHETTGEHLLALNQPEYDPSRN